MGFYALRRATHPHASADKITPDSGGHTSHVTPLCHCQPPLRQRPGVRFPKQGIVRPPGAAAHSSASLGEQGPGVRSWLERRGGYAPPTPPRPGSRTR
eukprot:scaffold40592_cov63-Phaeocystis_antarctica.AAC.1